MKKPIKKRTIVLLLILAVALYFAIIFIGNRGTIDSDAMSRIEGRYYVEWTDEDEASGKPYEGYWDMGIGGGDEEYVPYFYCIDGEAGNPGFEGEIVKLTEDSITIRLELMYFEDMPMNWKRKDPFHVRLDYRVDGNNLILGYKGEELTFTKAGPIE